MNKGTFACTAIAAILLLKLWGGEEAKSPMVLAYVQPQSNHVYYIKVTGTPDGDSVTADILVGKLGGDEMWMHNVRLRLKGVSAFEIHNDKKSPQTSDEDKIAVQQRDALSQACHATDSQPITARLTRGSYDRLDAVLYNRQGEINSSLVARFPQGGRGTIPKP